MVAFAVRAQLIIVKSQSEYDHVKDSIMQHYYPGMFNRKNFMSFKVPTQNFPNYRSKMYEVCTPLDNIRCMYEINFFGHASDKEVKVDKNKNGEIGSLTLFCVDFSNPSDSGHLSVEFLPIKRLKKRYKFKVTKNILCMPPKYPKKEVKRITAVIEYIPHLTSSTAQFWVDHLPYGTKAKGITYFGE